MILCALRTWLNSMMYTGGALSKTPFLAAISHDNKGRPVHMRMSKVKAFTSSEIEHWALRHLDDKWIVTTDDFRPFSNICHVVDFHHSINTTGIYKNPNNKLYHWVDTMIGSVKRSIHGTYHSGSSKHLP